MLFVAWVAYNGIDQIKWVQNIGSPILIVVMIALLFWAYSITPDGTGFFEVMAQPNDSVLIAQNGGFALCISYRSDGQHRILGNDGTEHS